MEGLCWKSKYEQRKEQVVLCRQRISFRLAEKLRTEIVAQFMGLLTLACATAATAAHVTFFQLST